MPKLKKKAIGIFGGSFDPPHEGHIEISKATLKKINLKKIYWIITKKNPFKNEAFFPLKDTCGEFITSTNGISWSCFFISEKVFSAKGLFLCIPK